MGKNLLESQGWFYIHRNIFRNNLLVVLLKPGIGNREPSA
jgi:hypothetical protein